jgi:hypothetical protein
MKNTFARAFSPSLLPSFSLSSRITIVPQVTVRDGALADLRAVAGDRDLVGGSGFLSAGFSSVALFALLFRRVHIIIPGIKRSRHPPRRLDPGFVSLLMDISSEMITRSCRSTSRSAWARALWWSG